MAGTVVVSKNSELPKAFRLYCALKYFV